MDTAARIDILRRSGFSPQTVAAIVGVDYAEVQEFASDPSDVPPAPGGGGAAPVSAKVFWLFGDPDFVAQETLDYADATGQSVYVGATVDDADSTKLWLPAGIYSYSSGFNWNIQSQEGTYRGFTLSFGYDEGDGVVPDQLNVATGDGSFGADGTEVPVAVSSLSRLGWGIATLDFYVQVGTFCDSPDLEGDVSFTIARTSA